MDILSADTFNKNAKQQINIKEWPHVLYVVGISLICGGIILLNKNLALNLLIIIAGAALIISGRTLTKKPSTEQYNKLLEGASDPEIARIILDWAAWFTSKHSIPFFQSQGDEVKEFPKKYRNARNMIMVLLGDERHRKALGVHRKISDEPFLYKKNDEVEIFLPLIQALSTTERYSHLKIYLTAQTNDSQASTYNSEDQEKPENFENEIQETTPTNQKEPSATDIEPSETNIEQSNNYKKKSEHAREYRYAYTAWHKYDILGRLVKRAEDPDIYAQHVKKNGTRKKWVKAFRHMYDHPEELETYLKKPNSSQVKEFVKVLYGKKILNYTSSERRNKFRRGRNPDLNDFIILLDVIDEKDLITEPKNNK